MAATHSPSSKETMYSGQVGGKGSNLYSWEPQNETRNHIQERRRARRRREKTRDTTRGTMVVVGNESKRPTPARRDHPSAIPDRSCPARPRRLPPIVAVPFAGELGVGFIILIGVHPRRTTCSALWDPKEIVNKFWVARGRVPPTSTPTPHYNLGL